MQVIKEDIKQQSFRPVYLLYGSEDYLKGLYQEKLKQAVLNGSDDMNYSYYEGKGIDMAEAASMAETLPFFSERRLLVFKNTGWFKAQSDFAELLPKLPSSTVLVFVETEVDKRNRLYKKVKELGYAAELDGMDERNLKLWISSVLAKSGKRITEKDAAYLLTKSGTDMKNLQNELEKLVCFAYDREVITVSDIDAVGTVQVTGKIFQMMDTIADHQAKKALELYQDLLTLRERPMTILYLLARQFNILLQVKALAAKGENRSIIAKKAGIPPFAVSRNLEQAKNFTESQLIEALEACMAMEERVKTGRMNDGMAVELLIVSYTS